MPLFDNIEAVRRAETFQVLGSFWNNVFGQKDKAQILLELIFRNQLLPSFDEAVNNLAGNDEIARRIAYQEGLFGENEVFRSGMLVFDDPDKQVFYGTYYDAPVVYDKFRINYFVIPIVNFIPLRLQSKNGPLFLGIDFFVQNRQWLFFRQDPRVLFPGNRIPMIEGWQIKYKSFLSFLTKVDTEGNDDLVVNWLRNLQTTLTFKLAVAAVAKLGIIRKGGPLQSAYDTHLGEMIYSFPDEVVRARYPHEHLVVGQIYEPNTIIGDVIQMFSPHEEKIAWWRQADWHGGIILDPILPGFSGIPLLDANTVAYTAGQDRGSINGSKVHARLVLSNNFDAEVGYWNAVQSNETATGLYNNTFLKLPEEVDGGDPSVSDTFDKLIANWRAAQRFNEHYHLPLEQPALDTLSSAKTVNALDTFFQLYLGDAAMVMTIDASRLPDPLTTYNFIRREAPSGGVLIILAYLSSHPSESIDLGAMTHDSVSIHPEVPIEVAEDIDLGALIIDYVQVTPIWPGP